MLYLLVLGLEIVQELIQGRPEIVRGVKEHATGTHVTQGDAGSTEHFKQVQYPFPRPKRVHEWGTQSAQILKEEANTHQVAGHSLKFGSLRPQVLGP